MPVGGRGTGLGHRHYGIFGGKSGNRAEPLVPHGIPRLFFRKEFLTRRSNSRVNDR